MAQKFEFRLHVRGPESAQDFVLPPGKAVLGRDLSCELVLAFPLVSRRHAQFTTTEEACEVVDLGSSNGTAVNGVKLEAQVPTSLSDGDVITIGPFEIQVEAVVGTTGEPVSGEQKAIEIPASEKEPQPVQAEKEASQVAKKAVKPPAKKGREGAGAEPGEEAKGASPPPQTPPPPDRLERVPSPEGTVAPGLGSHSMLLLNYLPGIYHTDFMSRFLALFESILIPIEWNIDNFDMYLDPGTAPLDFLPWLANWYTIIFDSTWSEAQRRTLLREAHQIYARRGTRWALSRVLEIYLGKKPAISEFTIEKEPFTFVVNLGMSKEKVNQELVEAMIDASKPAHTTYRLIYQ